MMHLSDGRGANNAWRGATHGNVAAVAVAIAVAVGDGGQARPWRRA